MHVHRGEFDVAAGVGGGVDSAGAVVVLGRGYVLPAFRAVDGLLEPSGDRSFDGAGVRAVVERADADLRRRQIRKLREGKRRNSDRAGQDDQQRANRGENWAADEKIDKHFLGWPFYDAKERRLVRDQDGVFPFAACGISVTGAPSTRSWPPSITTRAPFFKPSSTV